MSQNMASLALRASAILWIVWGFVHVFAGVIVLSGDTSAAIAAIADAVDPATLRMAYPDAAGAVINQHGFNLLWFGIATTIGAIFIWRESVTGIFVTAMVGGLADLGYFIFMDMGGYVNFLPGTLMTLVSSSAIILSFIAYFRGSKHPVQST